MVTEVTHLTRTRTSEREIRRRPGRLRGNSGATARQLRGNRETTADETHMDWLSTTAHISNRHYKDNSKYYVDT